MTTTRRYDIDWVRVIAIGLLLIYHVAISFQPWGIMIGFIANEKPWTGLWTPMTMLNVWRIPLLFFVSGMGVYFALQNRNWKQLFSERTRRILAPFLFGVFAIVPIHTYLWQNHYDFPRSYSPGPGHLWFLGNIFLYVIILSPVFTYLKNNENSPVTLFIKRMFCSPVAWFVTIGVFTLEAVIIRPNPYELYAMTPHGFFLGLLAFLFGFCFVLSGEKFWNMIMKWRWLFLSIAITMFILRLTLYNLRVPFYALVAESDAWIFALLAFAYRYLNHPSKALEYLSQAAYPVYILHMIFLFLGSTIIFKLNVVAPVQFVMVLVFTIAGCFGTYEIIRRVDFLRVLFGLKPQGSKTKQPTLVSAV